MSATSTCVAPRLGHWTDRRLERCRGGRQLLTVVNRRDGLAVHLDGSDVDDDGFVTNPGRVAELRDGGFLAGQSRPFDTGPTVSRGAGIVWRGAGRTVERIHAAALHRAFRPGWLAVQVLLGAAGAAAVIATFRRPGLQLHAHPAQIPAIIVLGLIAVAIHELGHALVTVHYGRTVHLAGIRLHLGAPAFYVESIDALLLTRRQRLVQAAAGPWAEWLATSAAAFVLLAAPLGAAAAVLQRFVVVNTFVIASNLLPFVGLDGALIFADVIKEPDLPFRARQNPFRGPRRELGLTAYIVANAAVAVGLLVMSAFFWWQLFGSAVSALWRFGTPGATLLAIVAVALGASAASPVRPLLAGFAACADRIVSRIVFRAQRRWRVAAITAMRSVPGISDLDASALGILAGQLVPIRCTPTMRLDADDLVWVRRRPNVSTAKVPLRVGAVHAGDQIDSDLHVDAALVVLPASHRPACQARASSFTRPPRLVLEVSESVGS